jgi:hypothetical protein
MSKDKKRDRPTSLEVNNDELRSAWKVFRENAVVRNCISEYESFVCRKQLVVTKDNEICSDFLQKHIENKIKPFLISCVQHILVQGYVCYNIVPAYKSKPSLPYPILVHFDDCCTKIQKTEYAEIKMETTLKEEVSNGMPKIESYSSRMPFGDGCLNSVVSTALSYAKRSALLYESEMTNIVKKNKTTYLLKQNDTAKDVDPFENIINAHANEKNESFDDGQLDKLTKALNANLNRESVELDSSAGIQFVPLPSGADAIPVLPSEVKLEAMIKTQEHFTCMICHSMGVPIDMLIHNVTHQTYAKIRNSRLRFKDKALQVESDIVSIAYRVFFLCFEKYDEQRLDVKLSIQFISDDDDDDDDNDKHTEGSRRHNTKKIYDGGEEETTALNAPPS